MLAGGSMLEGTLGLEGTLRLEGALINVLAGTVRAIMVVVIHVQKGFIPPV